jgi:hypothetical protein
MNNEIENLREKIINKIQQMDEGGLLGFSMAGPFICGYGGETDKHGFPDSLLICNTIGSELMVRYTKTEELG